MTLSVWIRVVLRAKEMIAYIVQFLIKQWITAFSYNEKPHNNLP